MKSLKDYLKTERFMSSENKGFTLIELVLVLVIMGLLTSLVAPAITSLTGLKLKTAARRIAAGLRYARSQAVTTGNDYQVVFNLGKGEVTVECLEKEEEPYGGYAEQGESKGGEEEGADEEEEVLPQRVERKKTYTVPKEIKLAKVIVDGEEITEGDEEEETWIDFYSNGSCSGGEIFLADEKERTCRIELNFLTGIVKITREEEN